MAEFDTPLTQESIDKMDKVLRENISQYLSGILTIDEFLMVAESMYMSYPCESLIGLIDPGTGLKYQSDAEVAAEFEQHCRDVEQPD